MKSKKLNEAVHQNDDGTTIIYIRRRNLGALQCLIDTADYETVRGYSWSALIKSRTTYAKTVIEKYGRKTTLLMHSLLLPDAKVVDHHDHDGLNNKRSNLRAATHRENSGNVRKIRRNTTSRYRGVSRHACGKFLAQIRDGGKIQHLGLHVTEEDAASAYNLAAEKVFGVFAELNELQDLEPAAKQPYKVSNSQTQLTLFF